MPTAHLYTRVSSSAQAEEGYSLAAQREQLERYCDYQGILERRHYEDAGISGRLTSRPALDAMLEALRPSDVVVVYSLSRLGRAGAAPTLALVERITSVKARLVSLTEQIDTETPTGRLMLTILAGLAELELETTRERVNMGVTHAAQTGRFPAANPPWAYTRAPDKRLVPHPEKAVFVTKLYEYAARKKLFEVVAWANTQPLRLSRDSKLWTDTAIWRLLRNPIHKGEGIYRFSQAKNKARRIHFECPAIVTPEIWQAAQRSRSSHNGQKNPDKYPLTGHLLCDCGAALAGNHKHDKYTVYMCIDRIRRTPLCPVHQKRTKHFRAIPLEQIARELIAQALENPNDLFALNAVPDNTPDPHTTERRVITAQLENLLDMRQHSEITREQHQERRIPLEKRLKEIELTPAPRLEYTPNHDLAQAVRHSNNPELSEILSILGAKFQVVEDGLELVEYVPFRD